jgi:hypothetical protein
VPKCATPRSKAALPLIPQGVSPSVFKRRNRAKRFREAELAGKKPKTADVEKNKDDGGEVEEKGKS